MLPCCCQAFGLSLWVFTCCGRTKGAAWPRNQKGVNRFLYYFIISGIAMPINNVALMKVMQAFHLVNTRIGIILLYAAINIPLSLFLAYGFVATIPREIDEAAVIDGCKPWQLFLKVIAPLGLRSGCPRP